MVYFTIIVKTEFISNYRSPRSYSTLTTKYIKWELLTKKQKNLLLNCSSSVDDKIFVIQQYTEGSEIKSAYTQVQRELMIDMSTILKLCQQDFLTKYDKVSYFTPTWPCKIMGIGYVCIYTY
jgi:hypothetical protein